MLTVPPTGMFDGSGRITSATKNVAQRVGGVVASHMESAPRNFFRQDRPVEQQHRYGISRDRGNNERKQRRPGVRQLEGEHDSGQRRAQNASDDGSQAQDRPESRKYMWKSKPYKGAERTTDHEHRGEHAARGARAQRQ